MIPKIKFRKIIYPKIPTIKYPKIPLEISKIRKKINFRKFYFRNQKISGKLKVREKMVRKQILGTQILGKID